ncbi:MAG: hypothetical protein VXZ35_12650, partial [Pseudomonadota bacterium]|nr:hypothetical protein [Pseudomonadota bacterium]
SRIDLIAAVVEDFYDRYDQWVMDVNPVPGAGWLVRERERVSRCLHFIEREPLSAMVFLNQQKDPEVAAVESRRLRAHLEMAVANVESAQHKGEIPPHIDPMIACAMTMGGIREVMAQIISNRFNQNHDLTLDHIMTYIAGAMDIRD